jgi:hypothetical protein
VSTAGDPPPIRETRMGEHDDDNDDFDNSEESNLVRDLRKQLKAAKKEKDELAEKNKTFEAGQRKASVADVLKERGARPELAKFYTGEDASKEAVASWIEENAELFGITTDDDTEPEVVEAAGAIARATSNAPQTKIGSVADLIDRINSAKTPAEKDAAFKAAGLL